MGTLLLILQPVNLGGSSRVSYTAIVFDKDNLYDVFVLEQHMVVIIGRDMTTVWWRYSRLDMIAPLLLPVVGSLGMLLATVLNGLYWKTGC